MFAAAFEKQPCKNASKINSFSEAAIKVPFRMSLFCICGEFFKKYLLQSPIFSKFACNALQL